MTGLGELLADLGPVRRLTAAEERDLARRRDGGDASARDEMVRRNLPMAIRLARGYAHRAGGLDLGDLVGHATIGLIHAAERFDLARGLRFSTYAHPCIRAALAEGVADGGLLVHVPRYVLDAVWGGRGAARVRDQPGFPAAVEAGRRAVRLRPEGPGEHGGEPEAIRELLAPDGDDDDVRPDPQADRLRDALAKLPPELARVVRLRHGLDGREPILLEEIARETGVHRETAGRRHRLALVSLRAILDGHEPPAYRRKAGPSPVAEAHALRDAGLSGKQIARRLGIGPGQVWRILTGKVGGRTSSRATASAASH